MAFILGDTRKLPSNHTPDSQQMIYMSRISIFKKPAENSYLGGFWGEKSRGANGFSIWPFLTLTGPLVKIGGQKLIFELYQYWYENMFYRFWTCQLRRFD